MRMTYLGETESMEGQADELCSAGECPSVFPALFVVSPSA
jgi:hypothetical protein